ncbi:MAG: hypothetical protein HKM24_01345 [Gammaproteobacteria bacterium]|nr:hypothetical protein [Gammaproteobacteria bacterium]
MSKSLVILVVHGMGDQSSSFDEKLKRQIRRQLDRERWSQISWQPVYYQPVLQTNQNRMFTDMRDKGNIDWLRLRKFTLFGLSDAASMDYRRYEKNSIYQQIQQSFIDALDSGFSDVDEKPASVITIAHSLGGQVASNFIWDAQRTRVKYGVFRNDLPRVIGKRSVHDQFLRLKTMTHFFTSGCNIPLFIAGLPKRSIKPIATNDRGWQFRWQNYYDPDDVLGWPLKPICPSYAKAIAVDKAISAGGHPAAWLSAWTPLSHNAYWEDKDFVKPLTRAIENTLS